MQRSGIGFRVEFHERARRLGSNVVGRDRQNAIEERFFLSVAPAKVITERSFLQRVNVARIQFNGVLQISGGFFPAPLTPLNVTRQFEYPRSIWERLAREFQLSQGTFVIEVSLIEMLRTRKMRFCCPRTKVKCCFDSCFS